MSFSNINRRSFLKSTAAGATGMVLASSMRVKAALGDSSNPYVLPNVWVNGKDLNPDIPNTRVVCCHDPLMITSNVPLPHSGSGPAKYVIAQDKVVDRNRVSANMDAMAMSLTQKSSANEAWATIFKKPDSKRGRRSK